MLFTRFFAAALALVPAIQVLAAPASVNSGLSIREPLRLSVREPVSLKGILASTRADIGAIKLQLGLGDPQSVQTATAELKATVDSLVGNLKSFKKAKTDGQNVELGADGIPDSKSWDIVGDAYELVKDVLKVVDQIKAAASAPTIEAKLDGVVDILTAILQVAPAVISIVLSIFGWL